MQVKLKVLAAVAMAIFAGTTMAQEVVKIGHVGPTSGAIAHLGKDNENGARMAIDELNAKGVTIGGKKVKFELLAEDDAADPKQATAVANKLVDAKVNGVIGHLRRRTRSTRARASRRPFASSPMTRSWVARSAAMPSRS
jgi:branched-chain amino acid transport system substrate-binding protein